MNTRKPIVDAADEFRLEKAPGVRASPPRKPPKKVAVTVPLSADVLNAFRATGAGWHARVDAALKDWLTTNSPA